ncbi:MAG: S41 family peptidase [Oculatellaceae cyanobacterium Prado106]|nr:S41 family peptidase [Oculatellaceae cyanobacterium Prado106]
MKQAHRLSRRLMQTVVYGGAIAATTTLCFLSSPLRSPAAQSAFQDSPKAVLDEAWQIVNREYVDTNFNQVDWQAARQVLLSREYSSTQQAYAALREQLKLLGDPYTRFMDPEQYQALTNQTSGELSGVGIRLQVDPNTKILTVVEPIENSPASEAGIQTGDRIMAIDGKTTQGMTVEEASRLIQGEVGTRITLSIERGTSAATDMLLTRARIEVPNVSSSIKQEGNAKIGYIRLTEFSSHAPAQMRRAIQRLLDQQVQGFVLDLRNNPGGLLHASVEIARMWVDSGSIVRQVDRVGDSTELAANQTALTDLPLTVLVNGNSASSSEILTGALMDNHRATVVGSQTFGKALVQSVHPLSDGSGLAVTVAHYYTPAGTDISHRGITPDIRVDLTEQQQLAFSVNQSLVATPSDPQYAEAVRSLQSTLALSNTRGTASSQVNLVRQVGDRPSN